MKKLDHYKKRIMRTNTVAAIVAVLLTPQIGQAEQTLQTQEWKTWCSQQHYTKHQCENPSNEERMKFEEALLNDTKKYIDDIEQISHDTSKMIGKINIRNIH